MQDRLKGIPDDALLRLKAQVDEEFKRRRPRLIQVGSQVTFKDRDGHDVCMMITGKGSKNYTGYECDEYGNRLSNSKWRVAPEFLMPVLPKKPQVALPMGVGKDKPAAATAAW